MVLFAHGRMIERGPLLHGTRQHGVRRETMEEGDYQTASPTGLPHVPTLLAALLGESERAGETGWAMLCDSQVRQIRTRSERRKLGAGDWAWGCGYRNLQMLFSAIQARPAYHHILALHPLLRSLSTPDSHLLPIPSILHWQRIIQDAWLSGFDPPGAAHFDRRLVGKKSWIGTTEVYVALSRLGLRCQIVDFPHPTGPNAQHVKLFQWVENYFKSGLPQGTDSTAGGVRGIERTERLPLYLQHEGHSRTIIGIEERREGQQLLILDPAKKVADPLRNAAERIGASTASPALPGSGGGSRRSLLLSRSNPPSLDLSRHRKLLAPYRLSLAELSKKKQYQILYVLDQPPDPNHDPQHQAPFHSIQSLRIL